MTLPNLGAYSVTDVMLVLALSFLLAAAIGWMYKLTHRGASYTQGFVQTLVLIGMVVALVMLIIGSNVARAFTLVGALSIVRFRNAVKDTRDVGFIFFTLAVCMAVGTGYYLLAVLAAAFISLAVILMARFDWYAHPVLNQVLRIQAPNDAAFETLFDDAFLRYTSSSELVGVQSVQGGVLTELTFTVALKRGAKMHEFLAAIRALNGNNRVTLLTGYNGTEI